MKNPFFVHLSQITNSFGNIEHSFKSPKKKQRKSSYSIDENNVSLIHEVDN